MAFPLRQNSDDKLRVCHEFGIEEKEGCVDLRSLSLRRRSCRDTPVVFAGGRNKIPGWPVPAEIGAKKGDQQCKDDQR
jgi:hypothetical protein